MGNYRFLNAWAEREQRRFEQQQANPRVPGAESTGLRFLQGSIAIFNMAIKFVILLPVCVVWTVKLIAQHTVQSLVLAVAVVMLLSLSAFTTGAVIHSRREKGLNWLTGLAPKATRSAQAVADASVGRFDRYVTAHPILTFLAVLGVYSLIAMVVFAIRGDWWRARDVLLIVGVGHGLQIVFGARMRVKRQPPAA